VTAILAIPLLVRLLALFMIGAGAAAVVNWATYRFAWNRRAISPWSPPLPNAPPRKFGDRVPIAGWLGLRREADLHGRRFWIRPLVVELVTGLALAALYLFETQDAARLWALPGLPLPDAGFLTGDLGLAEHLQFAAHSLLLCLMLAASLIDLDERIIPDEITVTGTLAALLLAAAYPWSLLPAAHHIVDGQPYLEFLHLDSPNPFPAFLARANGSQGLLVVLGCWSLWCFSLLPRRWNLRHGWSNAVGVFYRRLRRERLTRVMAVLWIAGVAVLLAAVARLSDAHWAALLTALVGMTVGGGVIWCVRIIGTAVLQKEAMGFGDVTLMAMIGAFLGWQACLMIFFIAPFFGLLFAIANLVLHSDNEIPYGPFLCLGAATVMLRWPAFWDRTRDLFEAGWLVPALLILCFVLMALLLTVYRLLLRLILGRR
jgi:prepilin signal peptidase PulO-like enzyme (type II secretory pathway)